MANWLSKLFSGEKQNNNQKSDTDKPMSETSTYTPKTVDTSFITNPGVISEKEEKINTLTDRERDVFVLLLQGKTIKSIAEELGISYSTVNTHMNSVYRKLNVNSKSQLIIQYND